VSAHAFSASARTKIEAKGGTCEVIKMFAVTPKAVPAKKAKPAKA
jgi:ribosomal protein L18E